MAGNCKPNVKGLGKEANYKIFSSHSNGKITIKCGLFNGDTPNEWNTENVFYWYNNKDYLEIEINNTCNIWRSGTASWKNNYGELTILKFKKGTYIDITDKIKQRVSPIINGQWEKTILNLAKGRYKFQFKKNYRIDSEWYIENLDNDFKFLIKQNDKYYSIKSEFYKDGQYKDLGINSVTNDDFKNKGFEDLGALIKEVYINSNKFKPINKLKQINDGKFQIVMKEIE